MRQKWGQRQLLGRRYFASLLLCDTHPCCTLLYCMVLETSLVSSCIFDLQSNRNISSQRNLVKLHGLERISCKGRRLHILKARGILISKFLLTLGFWIKNTIDISVDLIKVQ